MTTRYVLTCLFLLAAPGARAEVLLVEDWEAGSHGDSVTNAPYSWTPDTAYDATVSSSTPFTTLAFDGDTANTSGNVVFYRGVQSPGAGDTNYVLTVQAWLHPAGTWDGIGAARGGIIMKDATGANYAAMNWNYTQWKFDTWIDGIYHQAFFAEGLGTNEIVDLTIRLDLVAGEATATLAYSGGTTNITKSFGASYMQTIDRVQIWSDSGNGSWPPDGAVKIDNLRIGRGELGLAFTGMERAADTVLSFQSESGGVYRLQYNSDPPTQAWSNVGYTLEGTGDEMKAYDPTGFSTQKSYRILGTGF